MKSMETAQVASPRQVLWPTLAPPSVSTSSPATATSVPSSSPRVRRCFSARYIAKGMTTGERLTISDALAAVVRRTPMIHVTKCSASSTAPGSASSRSARPKPRLSRRNVTTSSGVSAAAAISSRIHASDTGGSVDALIHSTADDMAAIAVQRTR